MHILCVFILCASSVIFVESKNAQPRDLFDDADDLLETYKNTVADIIVKASAQFEENQGNLRTHRQAVTSVTSRLIFSAHRNFVREVEELAQKAVDNNLDPTICTDFPLSQFSFLTRVPLLTSHSCADSVLVNMLDNLRLAFGGFNDVVLNETVEDYSGRIALCRSNNDDICILTVSSQIAMQNDMLPIMFESETEEVLNQFSNLELYFQECFSIPTQMFNESGTNLVRTARECTELLIREQGQ